MELLRSGDLKLPEAGFRLADADPPGHVLLIFGAVEQWCEEDQLIEGHRPAGSLPRSSFITSPALTAVAVSSTYRRRLTL
jgi:hypothetical protein